MTISSSAFSRRRFLRAGGLAGGAVLLAACGQAAPSQPAPPAQGAAATSAPASGQTAPAAPAAKPADAAKPAAPAKAASGQIVFMDGIAGHTKVAPEWGEKFTQQNS